MWRRAGEPGADGGAGVGRGDAQGRAQGGLPLAEQAERWISTLSALNPRRPNSIASATATQAAGHLEKVTPDRA